MHKFIGSIIKMVYHMMSLTLCLFLIINILNKSIIVSTASFSLLNCFLITAILMVVLTLLAILKVDAESDKNN